MQSTGPYVEHPWGMPSPSPSAGPSAFLQRGSQSPDVGPRSLFLK